MYELVNIPINSQLCFVTMETIWKNTGYFIDGNNINIYLKEIGVDLMNWIELTQDRYHRRCAVNTTFHCVSCCIKNIIGANRI